MARAIAMCTCNRCGKSFKKIKYCSNRREADSWESWVSSNITVCDECRKKEHEEALLEKRAGLVKLSGSEKQVAWAENIRDRFVSGIEDAISSTDEEFIPLLNQVVDYTKSITSASWWIEHRNFLDSADLANVVLSENRDKF